MARILRVGARRKLGATYAQHWHEQCIHHPAGQGILRSQNQRGRELSNHNFNTPPDILERVHMLDKRGIGLDPCSNVTSLVNARVSWDEDANGLKPGRSWRGHGLVFMNPPHSMSPYNIEPWIERAYYDFTRPDFVLDQFVGLIPAKTDTAWFHDFVVPFPVKLFLRGRPTYWLDGKPMPGPGKFASMLIYAGGCPTRFGEIFADMGWLIGGME